MGAQLLQSQGYSLGNSPSYTMGTTSNNGYNTTLGNNFNYTTPTTPYWGTYIAPKAPPAPVPVTTKKSNNNSGGGREGGQGGQVYYDARTGQYYTQNPTVWGTNNGTKNYIGTSPTGKNKDNPADAVLQDYGTYIPPEMMPDVNASLLNPNALLGAMQSAGIPMAGAGRFANLLSTNTSTGNK
jgi:hypothetical protein